MNLLCSYRIRKYFKLQKKIFNLSILYNTLSFSYLFLVPLGYYKILQHLKKHQLNNMAASRG